MLQARVSLERLRFVPHLTIARNAKIVLPPTPIEPIEWAVDEFVLIRSRLDLQPVRYDVIGRWPLQGPSGGAGPASPSGAAPQLDLF